MLATIYLGLRILVAVAFLFTLVVATTHWMVQRQKLAAFGWWPRTIRRVSDPLLQPIERRLLRSGGNPQNAPLWLAGLTLALGLIVLWLFRWIAGAIYSLAYAAQGGPRFWMAQVAHWIFWIVEMALIVRVIGSWIGANEYTKWMRPFVVLTEWLLAPLRRIVPPLGMIDITPLIAYFLLVIAERAALGMMLGG
ncbi:MAG TPA: YggT family protein [Gemmatimonadales bacterium]|nr:YggT family protein [Gemmatimonadales bacterium]